MAVRLFFGVQLPPSTSAALRSVCRDVAAPAGWRWIDPANWHLTLIFLGAADELHLDPLRRLGREAAGRCVPTEITLNRLGWLPSPDRRRLMAALSDDAPALACLHSTLASGAQELGFTIERRPLLPHVTLLRRKRDAAPWPEPELQPLEVVLPVTSLTLYRSDSAAEGPRYTPLWSAPLGA